MKAQVTMVEMIISVIVLFIAFTILFPGFLFKSRWDEALLLTKGRDTILTMERTNNLTQYSFNSDSFQKFINKISLLKNDTVIWTEIEDVVKSRVVIACNCTNDTIANMSYWIKDLKINNRSVTTSICYTNLEEKINPCISNIQYPDVLVIWGYKDLSQPKYLTLLKDFLNNGNGIVEIADLPTNVGNMQKQIFGITDCSNVVIPPTSCTSGTQDDSFIKPATIYNMTYQPFKDFYYTPFPVKAPEITITIPVEGAASPCTSATSYNKGNFTFRGSLISFWICNDSFVYFDSNSNNQADYVVKVRNSFNLSTYNFSLSYISNSSISISFRQTYNFINFLAGTTIVFPIDSNIDRIFLFTGYYTANYPIPVVILNGTFGKTAWVADFSRNGLNAVRDDQKQLLNSLILSVSNKKPKELTFGNTKIGYATSYLNVLNYDMFEIYRLNLGLGRPF